jgi:hypothetical protein
MVLRQEPRNSEAHRGIAHVYAWEGDKDKALYHSQKALEYAPANRDARALRAKMIRGREPYAGACLIYLAQPGLGFGLGGYTLALQGRFNPMTNVTVSGEIGPERYWNSYAEAGGALLRLEGQYRLSTTRWVDGMIALRGMAIDGGAELQADYTHLTGPWELQAGFSRSLLSESLLSLAGGVDGGDTLGAAREHLVYGEARTAYRSIEAGVKPFFGFVTSRNETPNSMLGIELDAGVEKSIRDYGTVQLRYRFGLRHYAKNHISLNKRETEPLSGGYFSPQFMLDQGPRLRYEHEREDEFSVSVEMGPVFQHVRENMDPLYMTEYGIPDSDGARSGFELHVLYNRRIQQRYSWTVSVDYGKVTSDFSRFTIANYLHYLFL